MPSSKGGSSSGTQTQKVEPWAGAQPYLLGTQGSPGGGGGGGTGGMQLSPAHQNLIASNPGLARIIANDPAMQQQGGGQGGGSGGIPGIFPEAARLYQQGAWSPEMQAALGNMQGLAGNRQQQLADRANDPRFAQDIINQSQAMMGGHYDPDVYRVNNIASGGNVMNQQVNARDVSAMSVDPVAARASQGVLDPTNALFGLLSGQINNPHLDQQIAAMGNDLSANLNNNVLPQVRGQSIAAGGYGGSRQGIAEGLATQGVTQQLANQAAQLRGNAFEAAQNRQYGTANALNEQAVNNATNNANRDLTANLANQQASLQASLANASNNLNAQQFNSNQGQRTNEFNANLGLQNNAQNMQAKQQQVANRNNALGFLGAGLGMQDNTFNQQFGLAQNQLGMTQQPNQYNWQNLNNYASIIQPGAGLGSSATSSTQNPSNPAAGALGGGLAGYSLATSLFPNMAAAGPWGAAAGGILGLLSDRRAKTDIKRVGTLDSGLPVYRYRYKDGGPFHIGVMAQEAAKTHPHAVGVGADGLMRVDYSQLG